MKIYTVTNDFYSSVKELFKDKGEVEVLPKNYREKKITADLVIFTGGEDINPTRYRETPDREFYNDKRDEWELTIFHEILSGSMEVKKVLGICRGLQLINVGMGGTLYKDIFTDFGMSHPGLHALSHTVKDSAFAFLQKTNSMHHQAAKYLGKSSKYPHQVFAIEPQTKLPEIISWGNKFLGVQFHPEFFDDSNPYKAQLASIFVNWVTGSLNLREDRPTRGFSYADLEREVSNRYRVGGDAITPPAVNQPTEAPNNPTPDLNLFSWGDSNITVSTDWTTSNWITSESDGNTITNQEGEG